MAEETYWKQIWPSSEVFGQFLAANGKMLCGSTVIELGSGATGIAGLIALKCNAKRVIFTDHPRFHEARELLRKNCELNGFSEASFVIESLDWNSSADVDRVIENLDELHFVLASDVFFDPSVFEGLVSTISRLLHAYPKAVCLFTYQIRDSDWTIEDLLILNELRAVRIRRVDSEHHSFDIAALYPLKAAEMSPKLFAGIEGGATHSKMIVVDQGGMRYGLWRSGGLNYYLEGYEQVVDKVAKWLREVKIQIGLTEPFAAVGMGFSGAEDDSINASVVALLKEQHGDVADDYYLGSDSVVTIAATFAQGGVIVIAGTGSSCRLLKADGSVHAVGGWGHLIGDGGSGTWISLNMIRYIFDDEDGLKRAPHSTARAKELMLRHFGIKNIIGMLDLLYAKFEKSKIASFAGAMAQEAQDDPMVKHVFEEAGEILGLHIKAMSKHFDEEMFANVPVVAVGSIWNAWDLMKPGFLKGLRDYGGRIKQVSLHKLEESPALGAALMAAKKVKMAIAHNQSSEIFDVIAPLGQEATHL